MRLRLRIERNALPPVLVLWYISDNEQRMTIAQLLQHIDEKIPLEGATWGLEDYAVTVSGYEALHYNELGCVCKDEDEVVIRALQWRDRKHRMLAGRDQISRDGRHLVDGVPFGRPMIRRAVRPDIQIPPLKRQKLDLELVEGTAGKMLVQWKESDQDGEEEDDDEDDDEDYTGQDEEDEDEDEDEDEIVGEDEDEDFETSHNADTGEDDEVEDFDTSSGDSDSDSSSDSDSEPSSDSDTDSSGSDSDSNSDADSDSDSDSDSEELFTGFNDGVDGSAQAKSETADAERNMQKSKSLVKPEDRGIRSNANDTKRQKTSNICMDERSTGIPFQGKAATRDRNHRRRDAKKLKYLKEQGILPPDASLEAMYIWNATNERNGNQSPMRETAKKALLEASRQRLLQTLAASGGVDVTPVSQQSGHAEDSGDEDDPPEELSSAAAASHATTQPDEPAEHQVPSEARITNVTTATNTKRASRIGAVNRLIFGSLGLKAPKTQDEANSLQAKLLQRSMRAKSTHTASTNSTAVTNGNVQLDEAEDDTNEDDEEAWRRKLIIDAVECCDEGITLSAPPFPFRQRWDPQYQTKRKQRNNTMYTASNKRQKKANGHAKMTGGYVETYDKYNNDTGDALNYDDVEEEADGADSYWEEGALLHGENEDEDDVDEASQQLLAETTAKGSTDEFPALPDDISTLPNLDASEAAPGDFVTYRELVCSAATKWQPRMTTRTARLEEVSEEGWRITSAPRDLPPKKYDKEGNRVYTKFEMEGLSDDEEDEDQGRFVVWSELIEPKLLQRPTSTENSM